MATPPGDRCCKSQDSVKQRSIFSNYGNAEAQAYQQGRSSYPPALYDKFLSYHRSMGGLSALLLDVVAAPAKLLETSLASSTRLLDVLRARVWSAWLVRWEERRPCDLCSTTSPVQSMFWT